MAPSAITGPAPPGRARHTMRTANTLRSECGWWISVGEWETNDVSKQRAVKQHVRWQRWAGDGGILRRRQPQLQFVHAVKGVPRQAAACAVIVISGSVVGSGSGSSGSHGAQAVSTGIQAGSGRGA